MTSGSEVWRLLASAPIIIVVTATAGFRHDSISIAEQVIADLATRTTWFEPLFVRTPEEIPSALSSENLRAASVVMFVNTTGELEWAGRDALLQWIRDGGSFIGVHSASDTWHAWPEYIDMLGGEFMTHPAEANVNVVVDESHAATAGLESPHPIFEEIYTLGNLSSTNRMLLQIDDGRPIAWYRTYGAGRVLYTALGHRIDVWTSQWFQQHLTGAMGWALRRDVNLRRRAVRR